MARKKHASLKTTTQSSLKHQIVLSGEAKEAIRGCTSSCPRKLSFARSPRRPREWLLCGISGVYPACEGGHAAPQRYLQKLHGRQAQ